MVSARRTRPWLLVLVALLVVTSGCESLAGSTGTREPFDAPDPELDTEPPPTDEPPGATGPSPSAASDDPAAGATTVTERSPENRWASIRPTCERPPALVVAVQVEALRNNEPPENRGIRTAWYFSSPSNKRLIGPYDNFVGLFRTEAFEPLTTFRRVTYGPVNVSDGTARQQVRLDGPNGSHAYEFVLERQTEAPFEGCWMTERVVVVEERGRTSPTREVPASIRPD